MFRQRPLHFIPALLLLACMGCTAADRTPKALVPGDEWVFQQVRELPGEPQSINPYIRFGVMPLKDVWIAHATAITNEQKPVWDLQWKLPASRCVQDFVGRSDLDMRESCTTPLSTGLAWRGEASEGAKVVVSDYVVEAEEKVATKAGEFLSVRIAESTEIFTAGVDGGRTLASRLRSTYWFSWDAKAFVRIVREYANPKGELTLRTSEELVSFKPSAAVPR